jgi:cell pole-organizing protein PopZ
MSTTTVALPVTPAPVPVRAVAAPGLVLAALVGELSDVLDRLAAQAGAGTVTALRGPGLLELTEGLWSCVDRATAVAVHATGELHASGETRAAGYVTTRAWLRRVVGLADRDAKATLARAVSLRTDLAATWTAWNTGQVSGAAAREISLGLASVYRAQPAQVRAAQTPVAEAILLQVAQAGTLADVAAMVENLRAAVDTDGTTAAALAAHEDQTLTCAPVGTMVTLTGYLSKESHALLATALEAIIEGWYRTGTLPADQPTGQEHRDARTRSRRRPHLWALALTELARRQLENGLLGTRHGVKPHLNLTVDLDRHTAGLPSALRVPGQPDPTWLTADSTRRILCDADLTTVAVTTESDADVSTGLADAPSRLPEPWLTAHPDPDQRPGAALVGWLRKQARTVLYVGREHRIVPRRLRVALETRDQHCAFPDCTIDVSRCDAHHVQHWEHGGHTDLDNLVLLCTTHHHHVHEGGWQLTPTHTDPGRHNYWAFTPPPRPIRP